jgi:chromosome segregation ATPase
MDVVAFLSAVAILITAGCGVSYATYVLLNTKIKDLKEQVVTLRGENALLKTDHETCEKNYARLEKKFDDLRDQLLEERRLHNETQQELLLRRRADDQRRDADDIRRGADDARRDADEKKRGGGA